MLRGDPPTAEAEAGLEVLRGSARRSPGHLYEATAARLLVALGRAAEAGLELERALPGVLAGSGPRWLGAAADLAVGGGRDREHLGCGPALLGAGRLPRTAGGVGGREHGHRTGRPITSGSSRPTSGGSTTRSSCSPKPPHGRRRPARCPSSPTPWLRLGDTLARRARDGDAQRASGYHRRARDIAAQLGMPGLLASMTALTGEWTLRRDGPDWLLVAGAERARLRAGRGVEYLRALLAAPGREITALDLVAGGVGLTAAAAAPLLDTAARDAYRKRLAALEEELDAADAAGDSARAQTCGHRTRGPARRAAQGYRSRWPRQRDVQSG